MIDRYNLKNPTVGTLYITATHIIFVDPETNKETWVGAIKLLCIFSFSTNKSNDASFWDCRFCTCTLAALRSCRWPQLDRHCWSGAKHFYLWHLWFRARKNAMTSTPHCRNCISRCTYRICTVFNTHRAPRNWPNRLDGIILNWMLNSNVNACRMTNGHCAIWTWLTNYAIPVSIDAISVTLLTHDVLFNL